MLCCAEWIRECQKAEDRKDQTTPLQTTSLLNAAVSSKSRSVLIKRVLCIQDCTTRSYPIPSSLSQYHSLLYPHTSHHTTPHHITSHHTTQLLSSRYHRIPPLSLRHHLLQLYSMQWHAIQHNTIRYSTRSDMPCSVLSTAL